MDSLIQQSGVTFAAVEDAAGALLKFVSDEKVNGQLSSLWIFEMY